MNEQIIIPYLGSFLSLFLIAIHAVIDSYRGKIAFAYSIVILSSLNLVLCYTFGSAEVFKLLNVGLIVYGAGGLFSDD